MYSLNPVASLLVLIGMLLVGSNLVVAGELSAGAPPVVTNAATLLPVAAVVTVEEPDQVAVHIMHTDCNCLTVGEIVAIVGGAVVGGASADFFIRSAPFAVIGIVAGAAVGSMLYRYVF